MSTVCWAEQCGEGGGTYELLAAEHEDSTQNKGLDAIGMSFSVCQREGASPGASEYNPLVDAEMLTDLLDIIYKMPCGVILKASMRSRFAGTTLVEQNNAIHAGIEELTVPGITTTTYVKRECVRNSLIKRWVRVSAVSIAENRWNSEKIETERQGNDLRGGNNTRGSIKAYGDGWKVRRDTRRSLEVQREKAPKKSPREERRTRSTMEDYSGLSGWVTTLFIIQSVNIGNLEKSRVVRLDGRIKSSAGLFGGSFLGHHCNWSGLITAESELGEWGTVLTSREARKKKVTCFSLTR